MNGRQTFNASVVDYVFAERDRLEKENRKLRNELAAYKGSEAEDVIEYLRQECASFEDMYRAEASANARLRELIYKMWLALKSVGIVGGIYTYPDRNTNLDEEIDFRSAMRRFGIEVN